MLHSVCNTLLDTFSPAFNASGLRGQAMGFAACYNICESIAEPEQAMPIAATQVAVSPGPSESTQDRFYYKSRLLDYGQTCFKRVFLFSLVLHALSRRSSFAHRRQKH